jgi:hypothetical protein
MPRFPGGQRFYRLVEEMARTTDNPAIKRLFARMRRGRVTQRELLRDARIQALTERSAPAGVEAPGTTGMPRERPSMPKGMEHLPQGMSPRHPAWDEYLEVEAERLHLQELVDKAITPEAKQQLGQLIHKAEPGKRRVNDWIYNVNQQGQVEALHPSTHEPAHMYVMRKISGIPRPFEYKTRVLEGGKVQAYRERLPMVSSARRLTAAAETRKRKAAEMVAALKAEPPENELAWKVANKTTWRNLAKNARAKDTKTYFKRWWDKMRAGGPEWYTSSQARYRPSEARAIQQTEKKYMTGIPETEKAVPVSGRTQDVTIRARNRPVIRDANEIVNTAEESEGLRLNMQRWVSEINTGTHPLDAYKEVVSVGRGTPEMEEGLGTFAREAQRILMKHRKWIGLPAAAGVIAGMPDEAEAGKIPKGVVDLVKKSIKRYTDPKNMGGYLKEVLPLRETYGGALGELTDRRLKNTLQRWLSNVKDEKYRKSIQTALDNAKNRGDLEIAAEEMHQYFHIQAWNPLAEASQKGKLGGEEISRILREVDPDDGAFIAELYVDWDPSRRKELLKPVKEVMFGKDPFTKLGVAGAVGAGALLGTADEAEALPGKRQMVKMIRKLKIPEFKSTNEAEAFGEIATSEQVQGMKTALDFNRKRYANLEARGASVQERRKVAIEGQLYREAIETAETTARAEEVPVEPQEMVNKGIVEPEDLQVDPKPEVDPNFPYGGKPLDIPGLRKTIGQGIVKNVVNNLAMSFGLTKGLTSVAFFVPGYKETVDHTEEKLKDIYEVAGQEPYKYVQGAAELAGEFAPITAAMSGARWTIGALRWSPTFWNKFIMTGAFGAAYETARGEVKSFEEFGGATAIWGGFEALPYVGKGVKVAARIAGKTAAAPFKLTHRYMKKRDAFADKVIETAKQIAAGEKGLGPIRIPQPEDMPGLFGKAIESYGYNWREWMEPAMQRMDPALRRLFRDYYIKLGLVRDEAFGLAERIITGSNLQKGVRPLDSGERTKLYEYFAERFKLSKTPAQAYKEAKAHAEGTSFWSERAAARGKKSVLADMSADRKQLVKEYARDINKQLLDWQTQATQVGWKQVGDQVKPLMSSWTFQKNLGTWLGRYYNIGARDLKLLRRKNPQLFNEIDRYLRSNMNDPNILSKTKMLRLDLTRFLKRTDLPTSIRSSLGEVVDAGEVAFRSMNDLARDVETAKLFQTINNMKNVVKSRKEWKKLAENPAFDARKWEAVPTTANSRYGMLEGKFINRDVFLELKSFIDPVQMPSPVLREAMSLWKFGKVAARPSTHFRNMMSNVVLNHIGGMPMWSPRALANYEKAFEIVAFPERNKQLWNELRELGVFTGTFGQEELRHIRSINFKGVKGIGDFAGRFARKVSGKASRLYTLEEHWAKAAKYLHNRGKGMTEIAAAEDAIKSTFHYGEVTPFIRRMRTSPWGFPFATFSYKALPYIMDTTIRAPWRIGGLMMGLWAAQEMSLEALNIRDDEWRNLHARLPSYVKNGNYMPMPFRDEKGRLQLMDLTYILPWGDVNELMRAGGEESRMGIGRFVFANPLYTTVYELAFNKNYAGQKIRHDWQSPLVQAGKVFGHIWQAAVPSLFLGGYDFQKVVWDTLFKEPTDYDLTSAQKLASQMGVKIIPRTEGQILKADVGRRRRQQSDIMQDVRREYGGGAVMSERAARRTQERLRQVWAVED